MSRIAGVRHLAAGLVVVALVGAGETSCKGTPDMNLAGIGQVNAIRMVSSSGPAYGPDTPKHYLELHVDCAGNTASWEVLRPPSDEPGRPIGLFRSQLKGEQCDSLVALFEQVGFADLRELKGVTPGHAVITVTIEGEEDSLTRKFSPIDGELMAQASALVDGLFGFAAELEEQPTAALSVTLLDQSEAASNRFSLVLKNVGSEPLVLRDPRRLPQDETGQAGIQIASVEPEEPGVTALPLEWRFVPVVRPADTSTIPELVHLDPAQSKLFPVEAVHDAGESSITLIQSLYIDYAPAPGADRAYQVRGATFSDILELEG